MVKKVTEKIKRDNERGARQAIIEDLFYDFNRTKAQVYWMNFVRGLCFGFGSILGGTVLIAILVWALGQFAGWFPLASDNIKEITNSIQQNK